MDFDDPFESLWSIYQVTRDCHKVARKMVNRGDEHFLEGTEFIAGSKNDAAKSIEQSRKESEDFVIVSLWATFERIIIGHLQTRGRKLLEEPPETLSSRLCEKFQNDVEYSRVDDILDLFKETIDADLIGSAKNIKRHRDWIVHRNPNRPSPGKVTPVFSYEILLEIVLQIQKFLPYLNIQ